MPPEKAQQRQQGQLPGQAHEDGLGSLEQKSEIFHLQFQPKLEHQDRQYGKDNVNRIHR